MAKIKKPASVRRRNKPYFKTVVSAFALKVFEVVRRIPLGQVLSYKEVARRAGKARAARAVGAILRTNYDSSIPCHRVIRSDGRLGGYNRGLVLKNRLLRRERKMVGH